VFNNTSNNNINSKIPFFQMKEKHPFHLVDSSLLPVVTGFSAMLVVMSLVFYWHPSAIKSVISFDGLLMQIAFFIFIGVLFSWFITVVKESGQGHHTKVVRTGLRYGMALFIVSEVMFFFAFFWGFFHFSLSPSIAIGTVWPPKSIQPMDIWGLPLVNTLLLLTSGVTITMAHHAILKGSTFTKHNEFSKHLLVTIILGTTFLICQGIEYKYGVTFKWKENVYGSSFFVTTGFHGFHVTVGTIFLLFCYLREIITINEPWKPKTGSNGIVIETLVGLMSSIFSKTLSRQALLNAIPNMQVNWARYSFTKEQHFGFEAAAWYWHFVDVVWLFLFITIYWWGS
jgi:heme/copper-type cytochrome/quinol oxidase subunit 3